MVILERISRLGFWEREANVRRDWRFAHCLQMLGSARRRLRAIVVAIVAVWLWCCNGSGGVGFGFAKFEVLRSLLTSSHATTACRVHVWLLEHLEFDQGTRAHREIIIRIESTKDQVMHEEALQFKRTLKPSKRDRQGIICTNKGRLS